jgi:hypothetical protein
MKEMMAINAATNAKTTLDGEQKEDFPNLKVLIETFSGFMKHEKSNKKMVAKIRKIHAKFILRVPDFNPHLKLKQIYSDLKKFMSSAQLL